MAHVGIAFAICFCIGPPIGAYFASKPLPTSISASGYELNVYATPAVLTLVLLLLETVFLVLALPETRGKRAQKSAKEEPKTKVNGNGVTNGHADHHTNGKANGVHKQAHAQAPAEQRLKLLATLRRLHLLFLGLFAGVEFTLTFLTFDRKCSKKILRVILCNAC